MNLMLNTVTSFVPLLNRQEHDLDDFERFCRLLNIRFRRAPIAGADGVYVESGSRRYIFINRRLKGFRLVFTAFHELGHALLHAPRCCETLPAYDRRDEQQADEFAMLSIMPQTRLADFLHLQSSPSGFEREIFRNRLRLYYDYGV